MPEDSEQSLRQVIGENARRLREEAGARQDDVANAARDVGLKWGRSKVAALERGDKALDVAEALAFAEALGEVVGHPVAVADLFNGDGAVRLTPNRVLYRGAVRRFLAGDPVELLNQDLPGGEQAALDAVAALPALLRRAAELAGPHVPAKLISQAGQRAGEAEERAGRTLGLSRTEVAWLAVGLWGRTLAEERDSRVGDDGTTASRSARRGRVTRQLVGELHERLAEVTSG